MTAMATPGARLIVMNRATAASMRARLGKFRPSEGQGAERNAHEATSAPNAHARTARAKDDCLLFFALEPFRMGRDFVMPCRRIKDAFHRNRTTVPTSFHAGSTPVRATATRRGSNPLRLPATSPKE